MTWTMDDIVLCDSEGRPVTFPLDTTSKVVVLLPVGSAPGHVPEDATEILFYFWIATGASNADSLRHFNFTVKPDENDTHKEVGVSICAYGYDQNAWSYNSENFWLPMPYDGDLNMQLTGETLKGNVKSGIKIIGYK